MKCANSGCGSTNAHALNVSVNVSETNPEIPELQFVGWTDFAPGSLSKTIGVICWECGSEYLYADATDRVIEYLQSSFPKGQTQVAPYNCPFDQ